MSTMYYNERAYCFLSYKEKAELDEAHKKRNVSFLGETGSWFKVHRIHMPGDPGCGTAVYRIHKPRLYQD